MDEFEDIGIQRTLDMLRERLGKRPIWITFVRDPLVPRDAPGVSNWATAGFSDTQLN